MDAIDFIVSEHDKIRELISKVRHENNVEELWRLFELLKIFLLRHEMMEENLWYPTLKKNKQLEKAIDFLIDEEKKAEKFIKKLNELKMDGDWKMNFKKLVNDIELHAKDEEEKLFPEVKKVISSQILDDLGTELKNFSDEAKKLQCSY